jgi:hypothetical protein
MKWDATITHSEIGKLNRVLEDLNFFSNWHKEKAKETSGEERQAYMLAADNLQTLASDLRKGILDIVNQADGLQEMFNKYLIEDVDLTGSEEIA